MKFRLLSKPTLFTILYMCLSWALLIIIRVSDVDISFSVLASRYGKQNLTSVKFGEYMKGDIVQGEFTAREENLGIVSVRLNLERVIDADKVMFRLKEKGSKEWYYENRYRITKLPGTPLFPFGFPIIKNSQGKVYQFEIEVPQGVPGNALQLEDRYPIFDVHYKFYKKDLLNNPEGFATFLIKKAVYFFSNINILISSLISLLTPLVAWVALKLFFRKLPMTYLTVLLAIYLTVYDTFYVVKLSETIILILTGMLLVPLLYLKLDAKFSFYLALVYLLIMSMLFFVGDEHSIQMSGVWAFTFLLIGLVQSYWEVNKKASRDKPLADPLDGQLNKIKKHH